VIAPTFEELRKIAADNHFTLTDEECQFFYNIISANLDNYARVSELPDRHLPTKYPRLPGHRPAPEENPFNAWYWRTAIKGASKGKLAGKTVALKDSIGVYGIPQMVGSGALDGSMADEDATVVTWILDEGGEIAGKATYPSFLFLFFPLLLDLSFLPLSFLFSSPFLFPFSFLPHLPL